MKLYFLSLSLCYCFIYYICRCYICGNIYYNCCLVWCLLKNLEKKEGVCVCVCIFLSSHITHFLLLLFSPWVLVTKSVLLSCHLKGFLQSKYASKKFSSGFILYYIQIHFWMIASDGFRILLLAFPHLPHPWPFDYVILHNHSHHIFYKTLAVNRIVLLYAVIWFFFHIPFKISLWLSSIWAWFVWVCICLCLSCLRFVELLGFVDK